MTKARDLANIISGGFTADDIPNLDASKITSGSIADARIPASAVSQHATSFDDNKIVNDISTLALRSATSENAIAYSTSNQFIDVFQDGSGIDTTTNVQRNDSEDVSSISSSIVEHTNDSNTRLLITSNTTNGSTTFTDSSSNNISLTSISGMSHSTAQNKIGSSSLFFDGIDNRLFTASTNLLNLGNFSNTYTIEFWIYSSNWTSGSGGSVMTYGSSGNAAIWKINVNSGNISLEAKSAATWSWSGSSIVNLLSSGTLATNQWHHCAFVNNNGTVNTYHNGIYKNAGTISTSGSDSYALHLGSYFQDDVESINAYMDSIRISDNVRYTGTFTPNTLITQSATGNFTGTTITAPSSVSSMGAIITYQDNAGTNTLNTDIVLQLSADNGSNFTTATMTALPDFSTGIKMAKVNDLSVTAGTQLKYKISFANQALGSKEARIRGVSLQY